MASTADKEAVLEELFDKLSQCIKNKQHRKAIKACDEILKEAPGDEDALRCKVAAHMQLDPPEFEQALALISKPRMANLPFGFEKGYCLYRLGKIDEALSVTQAALADASLEPSAASQLLQLEAQLQYRRGNSSECIRTYDKLFQQHKADSLELKTNVLAAYVAAGLASEIPDLMTAMKISARDSFEIGFNKACGQVEAGQLATAEGELRMAIKQGRETLFGEELGEDEVDDELSPLSCQLAYVLGKLGRPAEAAELYERLIRGTLQLSDEAVRALAHNNVISDAPHRLEPGPQNRKYISSCTRRLEALLERPGGMGAGGAGDEGAAAAAAQALASTPKGALPRLAPGLESRLGPAQKRTLVKNLGLLYLVGGRPESSRTVANILGAAPGGATDPHVAILAAATSIAEGKAADADRVLDSFCATCSSSGSSAQEAARMVTAPTLLRAQMALEAGNVAAAQALLAGIQDSDVAASGALVATRVALYEQMNDSAGAEALLESALAHWRSSASTSAPAALGWCLSSAVGLKLKLGKLDEATAAFKQLQASGVTATAAGTAVLARLARALAVSEPAAAPALVKAAAPAPTAAEVRSLGVDALEEGAARPAGAGVPQPRRGPDLAAGEVAAAAKAAAAAGSKRGGEAMDVDKQPKAKKARRKRKPRYPKGYNPELPNGGLPAPDPERWLPKWERSDYKKKRDRRRREKDAVKGSQGAGKVDESLDRTKAAAASAADTKTTAKPSLPPRKGKGKK